MKTRSKINYRKIYQDHHGLIPKDRNGKSYHIHHVDGNRDNNRIENLIAVSEEEHYNIHYSQGDYAACSRLATIMNLSKKEISELIHLANMSGECGFKLGHASDAGKIGGKKFVENAKQSGKKIFDLSPKQEIKRLYASQVKSAIRAGKACPYPRQYQTDIIYNFINTRTREHIRASHFDFCYQTCLDYYQIGRMIKEKKKSYHGWTLQERKIVSHSEKMIGKFTGHKHPSYDATIYRFQHKEGIQEVCTQYELRVKYNLEQANLSAMIRGKKKSVSGWKLDR